jgi:branched-chain amino acid transport system permease protein
MTAAHAASLAARHRTGLTLLGVCALLVLVPALVADPWRLGILNLIAIHALVALGLNLFVGYAGQISLGHAAFFGLGAYGSAVLATTLALPVWAAVPCTALGVAAAALAVGVPTLRLSGHYLAMATLGLNLVLHNAFVQADAFTGGPSGLPGIPPLTVLGRAVKSEAGHYYLLWATVMLALMLTLNLARSGVGRQLTALAEDETSAAVLGVDVQRRKIAVFVVSAIFASVAGSLFAHYMGTITPDTFGIFASIDFVIMVVIGGVGSLWGSLAGAAFVTVLPHILGPLEGLKDILYGGIVVATLLVSPRGLLAGLGELAAVRLRPAKN